MRVRLENTKFPCLRATRASLEAAAGLPSAGRDCYHAPLTQPSENGRRDRLLEARDRLDALESRWRSRHPAALQRAERFVRMMQGLASPPVESPSGQRPDLFRFPGLTARPWYEPGEFPWVPILERGWTEVRAEVDALLARPGAFRPFLDGEGAAYREEKFALGERRDSWTVCDLLSEEGARVCPRSLELDFVEQMGMLRIEDERAGAAPADRQRHDQQPFDAALLVHFSPSRNQRGLCEITNRERLGVSKVNIGGIFEELDIAFC